MGDEPFHHVRCSARRKMSENSRGKCRRIEIAGLRTDKLDQVVYVDILEALRQADPLWLFHAPIAVDGVRRASRF